MLTHIIFDVDGTLYNKKKRYGYYTIEEAHDFLRLTALSLLQSGKSTDHVADECALRIKKKTLPKYEPALIEQYKTLVKKYKSGNNVFAKEFGTAPDFLSTLISKLPYDLLLARDTGLQETIRQLKQEYTLGIITNDRYVTVTQAFERLGLNVYDFALSTGTSYPIFCKETGVYKPETKSFEQLLTYNGINPSAAIYVGDRYEIDIEPALQVGMNAALIEKVSTIQKKGDYFLIPDIYAASSLPTVLATNPSEK